jgi:hypothetical protein
MIALLLALALQAAEPPAADTAAPPEPPYPPGAPKDDYGLVSWCYGALSGYLELHNQAMPEVERIERTWRKPGSSLSEDLKVYGAMKKEGQSNLKEFAKAMEAAEKASLRPLNATGAAAVVKGRSTWAGAASLTKARLAQEWMSWTLPARCAPTAERLVKNASLAGAAFDTSAPPPETAVDAPAEPPAGDAAPTEPPAG